MNKCNKDGHYYWIIVNGYCPFCRRIAGFVSEEEQKKIIEKMKKEL